VFDLSGKVALVTGAGQHTGEGIALGLARQGAAVAVNDLREERASRVVARIEAEGLRAAAAPFDVTDASAVAAGLEAARRTLGPVDILVNNAGNAGAADFEPRPFAVMEASEYAKFVDVNLFGVLHCARTVLPGMCERRWGRIVTIASGAGLVGSALGISVYGAAKGGAIAFMRHLALEVARRGVTANTIALGLMAHVGQAEVTRELARAIPVGRLGEPEDAAAAVVWLASPEAGWVTGQTIAVDGGSTAR
jgi:NAD(P)-dependent dehydrogenase (short-subunit alcohol dehydrogenase family)